MKLLLDLRTFILALILTLTGVGYTIANVVVIPLEGSPKGYRLYYLTPNTIPDASGATGACASGFHMASMFEILDTSNLRYDTSRGFTNDDTGQGPPTNIDGWIRTGGGSTNAFDIGGANCNVWTNNSEGSFGTIARLEPTWDNSPLTAELSPWSAFVDVCDSDVRVWCVQDY